MRTLTRNSTVVTLRIMNLDWRVQNAGSREKIRKSPSSRLRRTSIDVLRIQKLPPSLSRSSSPQRLVLESFGDVTPGQDEIGPLAVRSWIGFVTPQQAAIQFGEIACAFHFNGHRGNGGGSYCETRFLCRLNSGQSCRTGRNPRPRGVI